MFEMSAEVLDGLIKAFRTKSKNLAAWRLAAKLFTRSCKRQC